MRKYLYKIGDTIINEDGNKGIIKSLGTSVIDNVEILSYWVLYSKSLFPDMCERNLWEKSIKQKL